MSHLRNLLHKPEPLYKRARASDLPHVQGVEAPPIAVLSESAATVAAPPPFAVEEAQIHPESRLIFQIDPRSPAADRFRYLRMRLRAGWSTGKLKKLLVTSPLAHDGKSTITMNLATSLAERGRRTVLVIEGDLHRTNLAERLGLRPWAGLADCLQDDITPPLSTIRRIEPLGWHLLPAGEARRNPTELLQSPTLGNIVNSVSSHFDWILIDSPPALTLTDALSLQHHADGTLLIVRAERTPREAVEQATELLGKKNIVGIVLNGVEQRNQLYSQYQYAGDRR